MTNLANISRAGAALRAFMAGVAVLLLVPGFAAAESDRPPAPPVVIELFTSQGCSSCPPADAFLGELAKRKDVIALTLPVDYWDYLGWKDTLASPTHARRQRAYAKRQKDTSIYTPQMVLNGQLSAVGSRREEVENAIRIQARRSAKSWVPVKLTSTSSTITVDVGVRPDGQKLKKASLWLLLTNNRRAVTIKRGENSGREIVYHNVVRQMVPIGTWTGDAIHVELSKRDLMIDSYDACTVLLQADGNGPIIGAAYLRSGEIDN